MSESGSGQGMGISKYLCFTGILATSLVGYVDGEFSIAIILPLAIQVFTRQTCSLAHKGEA